MNEWSLDVLYKGYYDEAFVNDFKKMDTVIQRCTQAAEQLCHDNEVKALHDMLSLLEEFHTLADRVGHFISLKQSTNTSDGKTVSLMNQFSQKFSGITKANARFNRYVAEIEDLDACIEQDALLKEYSYLLHTIKEDSTYLLSDDAVSYTHLDVYKRQYLHKLNFIAIFIRLSFITAWHNAQLKLS